MIRSYFMPMEALASKSFYFVASNLSFPPRIIGPWKPLPDFYTALEVKHPLVP